MADKEHPAAKAGRYVRAAGIVLGREIDRRSAAAAAKPAPPPKPLPPPAVPTASLFGRAVFGAFIASLVALVLIASHAEDALSGGAKMTARLVLGAIMLVGAALLTSNWRRANESLGQRILTRMWGPRGAFNRRERTVARILRDAITLIGIAFLAGAVFAILNAFISVD